MSPALKRFRIENQFGKPFTGLTPSSRLQESSQPVESAGNSSADGRIDDILIAVNELRKHFEPQQQINKQDLAEYRKEMAEIYRLKSEIDLMKDAIADTKNEIAALYKSDFEGKGMRRASGELDAVVAATEEATGAILSAIEDIESNANMLRAAGAETGNNDCIGVILERVISMYEACNFQDLTGQRITKIINVIKFVEERLDKMVDVWGGLDAFKDMINPDGLKPSIDMNDDQSLLNGPKLDDDFGHVSQNDIDNLFN